MQGVEINPALSTVVPNAVSFETGATRVQAADPSLCVYEHHGQDFGWIDPVALSCLFDDIIHGRTLPPTFVSHAIGDVDTLVALALHRKPNLVICPNAFKLVTSADLVHRRGAIGMAHADPDLVRFFQLLRGLFPKQLPRRQFETALETAVALLHDFIEGDQLPSLGSPEAPVVLDVGQRGFVVAETAGILGEAWVHLFRTGYLRGVVVSKETKGRRNVLAARRSPFVAFQLEVAARLLNEMERVQGEDPAWASDGVWLTSPPGGTIILVSHLLEVLVRV